MSVLYDMVIDFAWPSKTNTILVMQGDHLSRVCHFVLKANGKDMDVSSVSNYTVKAVLSDSSVIYDTGVLDVDDCGKQLNEITYAIPQALTENTGLTTVTVQLAGDDGSILRSFEFYIRSRNELMQEDDSSDDELAGFRDILNRATEAIEKIEALSTKSRLPNPYPLRIYFGDKTISYDGNETISLSLSGIGYLSSYKEAATTIVWGSDEE